VESQSAKPKIVDVTINSVLFSQSTNRRFNSTCYIAIKYKQFTKGKTFAAPKRSFQNDPKDVTCSKRNIKVNFETILGSVHCRVQGDVLHNTHGKIII
jgi:hypothetical protein